MNIFLSLLTSFFLGFLITPVVVMILKKVNVTEVPGGRKIHVGYIPSMGGVAIMLASFFGLLAWLSFEQILETRYFLVALAIMFSVGLRDDLIELSAVQKLLGQCIPAFFVIIMADIRISGFYGFLGIYELPYLLSVFLSFFILVVLTNSFNLIDGSDGLAGTLAVITLSFLGWWFYEANMIAYSLISFTIIGGIIAFLVYNWHPAKIFMGDTGSLSLGFALTVLVILFVDKNGTMAPWEGAKTSAPIAAGAALMIVPIYDTLRIFIRRAMKGKSPFKPDKGHVHHFLIRMGLRHDQVALVLGGVKCLFVAFAFGAFGASDHVILPVMILSAVALGLWMDQQTLIHVKFNCKNSPAISEKQEFKPKIVPRKKPIISEQILDNNKINMN